MNNKELIKNFRKNWWVVVDLDDESWTELYKTLVKDIVKISNLDEIQCHMNGDSLNDFRLQIIKKFNEVPNIHNKIYNCAQKSIEVLVGNELAIQKNANISIQLPQDSSSLLPLHSDVWAGNSPYEVVLWIPFVDVKETKSFYLFSKEDSLEYYKSLKENKKISLNPDKESVVWPKLDKGQALIFSHALVHGNVCNETNESRLSINTRFKSLLSPYGDKGLGDYFIPLNAKPVTDIGVEISSYYE